MLVRQDRVRRVGHRERDESGEMGVVGAREGLPGTPFRGIIRPG